MTSIFGKCTHIVVTGRIWAIFHSMRQSSYMVFFSSVLCVASPIYPCHLATRKQKFNTKTEMTSNKNDNPIAVCFVGFVYCYRTNSNAVLTIIPIRFPFESVATRTPHLHVHTTFHILLLLS